MAGELASELRESSDLPVGAARETEAPAVTRALPPQDCLQPLADLFARAGDRPDFLRGLTEYVRELLGASAVLLYERRDDRLALAATAGIDASDPAQGRHWLPANEVVEGALAERRSSQVHVLVDGRQHTRLTVPFFLQGEEPVCFTAYLPPERVAFADPCFSMLHLVTQFLVQRELLSEAHENEQAFVQATLLVEMFSRTADADTFKRALFTLATELEKFFGCQRVAIGTGTNRSCRVHAVSGMSSEEKRTLGFSQIGAAMREAIALDEILVWPGQQTLVKEVVVSANHDDLLHSFKSGRLVVAPLRHEVTGTSGALALLWPAGTPEISKKTHRLIGACRPHLAALTGYLRHSKPGAIRGGLQRLWRGSGVKRAALVTAGVVLVGTMVFPITYRVGADCELQPVVRRTVAAPFENRLYRAYVEPGDEVEKGEVLAELDGREIRVKLAEAIAERNAAVKERDDAMVQDEPAGIQMAQLEADRLALEVERLRYRNENLMIRSPIGGVVLTGNLERSEGVPVTSGQKLFEVAPLEEMIMEIAIPETEVRHVEEGMPVRLRLESDSGRVWESELANLHPVSEVEDGRNVFVGEAVLENENGVLRPGMKGSVRILSDLEPIGWILFHRLWEFLRLKLW